VALQAINASGTAMTKSTASSRTMLARTGLSPKVSAPVTDLERIIESHQTADFDQYADLPAGVLGLTKFAPGRRPASSISAELTESADDGQPTP